MSFLARIAGWFRAAPAPVPDTKSESGLADTNWLAVLRAAGFKSPEPWAAAIANPARRYNIMPGRRAAAFAATIAHESAGGTALVESLNYSPTGLRATWPTRFSLNDAALMGRDGGKPADQRAIAERAYGGRMGNGPEGSGDGWRYRGRGLIQLTGRDAYSRAADATGLPLVSDPDLAATPEAAAEVACWVWSVWKGCNPLADAGDIERWRRAINGGLNGLDDVRARYAQALRVAG